MWRFKFLLIGMVISGALGAVLIFVGRYAFDEIKQEVRQEAVAAVDDYFVDQPLPSLTEERVVISERDLTRELQDAEQESGTFNEDGLSADFEPGRIRILDSGGSNLASVTPSVVGGRIELGEPSGAASLIPFNLTGTVIDRIEANLAAYFDTNNAVPTSIEVTDREIIVLVEARPGETLGGDATPRATPRPGTGTATPAASRTTPSTARTATPATGDVVATATPVARITPSATRPAATATPAAEPSPTRVPLLGGRTRTATPTPGA